jgi:alpha-L-fucosidase
MGQWMKSHARSIYGCSQAPAEMQAPTDCRYTYNPETNRLYCHIFNWPNGEIQLPGLAGKVKYAQLLNDASEIRFGGKAAWQQAWETTGENLLSLKLPIVKPNVTVPVIEMFF